MGKGSPRINVRLTPNDYADLVEAVKEDGGNLSQFVQSSIRSRLGYMDTQDLTAPTSGGWVYFVEAVGVGRIKIGVTTNLSERLRDLSNSSPVRLRLLGVVRGDRRFESILHAKFARHRLHGEWFSSAPDILTYIRAHGVSDTSDAGFLKAQ